MGEKSKHPKEDQLRAMRETWAEDAERTQSRSERAAKARAAVDAAYTVPRRAKHVEVRVSTRPAKRRA